MKYYFAFLLLLLNTAAFCQPNMNEIKKHKIKVFTQTSIKGTDTTISKRVYDKSGHTIWRISGSDSIKITNEMKEGRIHKITVHNGDGKTKDDVRIYTYEPNGHYKETFIDGYFGMESYTWYNKKGDILKAQSPDGNTTTYTYNKKGKLVSAISDGFNNGVEINYNYTYNKKGLLQTAIIIYDGNVTNESYHYNNKGKVERVVSSSTYEGERDILYEYFPNGLTAKRTVLARSDSEKNTQEYLFSYEYY